MRRRCVHGAHDARRIVPKTAIQVARGCPWKHDSVVSTQSALTSVPSQTCVSSRNSCTCHGQSPAPANLGRLLALLDEMPHSVPVNGKNNIHIFVLYNSIETKPILTQLTALHV